mgnify:CR=1 FL=1
MVFQSTLPARGATSRRMTYFSGKSSFQSTLPARGATVWIRQNQKRLHFNPRSPHGERRASRRNPGGLDLFQSTLPARGATIPPSCTRPAAPYFNPRSPHGERHDGRRRTSAAAKDFNPRSPHGERLLRGARRRARSGHFNPRSPHGERLAQGYQINPATIFQSTLPARGATADRPEMRDRAFISIHAPRTGSDFGSDEWVIIGADFNPRSPHGERREQFPFTNFHEEFQSTLPHGERRR